MTENTDTDRFKVLPLETRPVDIVFNKDDHLDVEDDEAVMADDVDDDETARIYAESHRKGWATPHDTVTVQTPAFVLATGEQPIIKENHVTDHAEFAENENIVKPLPEEIQGDFDLAAYQHYTEEVRTTSATGGQKGVKPERYDLIPVEAMDLVARLYGFGAEKYAAHNWRLGYEWSKSYASMQRHASTFWKGEDLDPETELPHLAGVVFHALTLMQFMIEQPEYDDRYTSILKNQEKDPRENG